MKSKVILVLVYIIFGLCYIHSKGQDKADTLHNEQPEIMKKGMSRNPFPIIGYDSDIGFQYGLVLNVLNYGQGDLYPEYKYQIYTEVSRTTKGGGVNQIFFDSRHLLPGNTRITADLSYLTELTLNFYGFNGYDAVYFPQVEEQESELYISRVFYRHQRKFTRFTLDFQRRLFSDNLLWLGGLGYFDTRVSTVDINKLNKGRNEADKLPDTALLYDEYVNWGIIGANEKSGGKTPYFKAGLIYDSRDNEPNPMKGIWTELLFLISPKIFAGQHFSYAKMAFTHRQYFTLVKRKLSLVYRIGYQGTLFGDVPFYMQPYMITSFAKITTTDGLGGAKTIRGILRNRVVGDGIAFGNLELRWKFFHTILWKQNIYLAINLFADAGTVVKKIKFDKSLIPEEQLTYFDFDAETLHTSTGAGFRVVLNQNFIIAVDYGLALDKRDGSDGIYVAFGYLF